MDSTTRVLLDLLSKEIDSLKPVPSNTGIAVASRFLGALTDHLSNGHAPEPEPEPAAPRTKAASPNDRRKGLVKALLAAQEKTEAGHLTTAQVQAIARRHGYPDARGTAGFYAPRSGLLVRAGDQVRVDPERAQAVLDRP
jgi:hypothetical protein